MKPSPLDPGTILPETIEEAVSRLTECETEIFQAEMLQLNNDGNDPETGTPFTQPQRATWNQNISLKIDRLQKEIQYLKTWLKLKRFVPRDLAPVKDAQALSLIWRCQRIFEQQQRLSQHAFSDEQYKILDEIRQFLKNSSSTLLNEARQSLKPLHKSPANTIRHLALIARVSEEAVDEDAIREEWNKITKRTDISKRDVSEAARDYVQALAGLGYLDEATAIAYNLDQAEENTAYGWLNIARYSQSDDILAYTRSLGESISPQNRHWFFLALYGVSGDPADAKRAWRSPTLETSDSTRIVNHMPLLLLRSHLSWRHLERARALLNIVTEGQRRLYMLSQIAHVSGDREDILRFLHLLKEVTPGDVRCFKYALTVLAEYGYTELALEQIERTPSWLYKCAGFAILARHQPEQRVTMLYQVEQLLLMNARLVSTTHDSDCLYSVVYAQALDGRAEQAAQTAALIQEASARCASFLLVDLVSRHAPIPDFLLDPAVKRLEI